MEEQQLITQSDFSTIKTPPWYLNPHVTKWVYAGVAALIGLGGGNVDRMNIFPTSSEVLERLDTLENRVEILELEVEVETEVDGENRVRIQ